MKRVAWAGRGDINAFFGLMLDNAAVMVLLVSLIARPGAFTAEFVLTRMIPGTALGVLLGDLVYTWMAVRLARRSGRDDVTAMPLGLDTPSTFPVAFLVLLPALKDGEARFGDHEQAMDFAWHVGLTVLVLVGIFKIALAPLGNAVRRLVPRAGLLGSLAAVALALIAFLPLLDIVAVPAAGLAALLVILVSLVAHHELPGKIPGALAAVLIGVVIYQIGQWLQPPVGAEITPQVKARLGFALGLPAFQGHEPAWFEAVFVAALGKLPVILPFALATIVGGIDCTESAASAGDEYDTRAVLLTEGVASLVAGVLGGVLQTTPYIGHPAYKTMGGRSAYTLVTALFIGAVGCFGGFALLFQWLPKAAMYPILVFVGLEITAQSFQATPPRHYPALALATLPALAQLVMIVFKDVVSIDTPSQFINPRQLQTLRCLANGFVVTSMLWAAALATILDGRSAAAAGYFAVAALCAFFGIIHSPLPDEQIGLPGQIISQVPTTFAHAVRYQTPYHWAAGYTLVALLTVTLGWIRPAKGVHERGNIL